MHDKSSYINFLAKFGIDSAHPGGLEQTKGLLEIIGPSPDDTILDIGCGTGETSIYIAQTFGCRVTAVDFHPVMVERTRQKAAATSLPIQVLQANAEHLPFGNNTFDFVLAESVTVFTKLTQSLGEYCRVLQPGGTLIDLEMTLAQHLSTENEEEIKRLYTVERLLTEADWLNEIKGAGFKHVSTLREERMKPDITEKGSHFNMSAEVDFDDFSIWLDHIKMMEKYKDILSYNIYKGINV